VGFIDLYPSGLESEGSTETLRDVDEVVYRMVLKRLAVPGLPPFVAVGDVEIHFTVGPIRTQFTRSRQPPGLPFTYDKVMRRGVLVGEDELLTVCHLRRPFTEELGTATGEWRGSAETAVGLVATTLDERVPDVNLPRT
jgi:hypothetical protein